MNATSKLPVEQDKLWISGPWITEKEIAYVDDAIRNAWYGNAYGWHQRFESLWAETHGCAHAISTSNCTAALHLGLLALGVGPGDEVIVPDITWIATAAAISYCGARPVFVDMDPIHWCLDPARVEEAITPRTKAILAVDLYGNMAEWDALRAIADRHGLGLMEDAAEAVGGTYKGRASGTLGHVGVYSFHGTKTLTTGEGGMLVTDDPKIAERVSFLRNHGRDPKRLFWNLEVGYKYMMSSMQAALGTAQLERLDELVARKRETFGWYQEALRGIDGLSLNVEPEGTKSTYWMATVVLDPKFGLDKEQLIAEMGKLGVDGRPFFYPLSSMPAYADLPDAAGAAARNPVSYSLSRAAVNLPSSLALTQAQAHHVADILKDVLRRRG